MESGNYFVYNLGLNPAVNFNFMLRVEGVMDLPCKSIRAFQKENEYETIQEGGLNDYVHLRRKPISKPFTFQVERYVGTDIFDPLANGTELVLPVILYINRYSVYKEFYPVRCYVFSGCTVIGKEYGELNAEQSGLLLETTTIAYREMYTIDNPAGSYLADETWKFDGTKTEGNGNRKARHNENEVSLAEAKEVAKRWPEQASATRNQQNHKLEEEKKRTRKWPEQTSAQVRDTDQELEMVQNRSRKWPKQVSAQIKDGDQELQAARNRSRKWPEQVSAQIKDGNQELQAARNRSRKWPEQTSAYQVENFMGAKKIGVKP